MGRIGLAFKMFFQILFNEDLAQRARRLQPAGTDSPAAATTQATGSAPPDRPVSQRSDALILLETLQREARLLDFLEEDIQGYTDQQIGSAVREVHRGCHAVLDRLFGIGPVLAGSEGMPVEVPENSSPSRIRLVGKVTHAPGIRGTLVHAGWQASRCELPTWTGNRDAQGILAPAEIEIS
jgi:hypothetical protein